MEQARAGALHATHTDPHSKTSYVNEEAMEAIRIMATNPRQLNSRNEGDSRRVLHINDSAQESLPASTATGTVDATGYMNVRVAVATL